MNKLLERFAADYASSEQKLSGKDDDQSSIHYPTVFLFIGDEAGSAIEPMIRSNEWKWENSAGVIYFHVASGQTAPAADHASSAAAKVTRVELGDVYAAAGGDKTKRKDIWQSFYQEGNHLAELNQALRQVSNTIADYGRLYASFDRLHLAVITRVDDPMNALVAEISLLAQSVFLQMFKSVQMDLYALINERDQSESFGYASAVGISFMRELERMQQLDYEYSGLLQVTGDGLAIPVVHRPAPLFDLVYVLSDRNERGMTVRDGMQGNYEMISRILLLKNRKRKEAAGGAVDSSIGAYNNASFKNSLLAESGRQGFVSAGLAKVQRPNYSIALTVLYQLCKQLTGRMKEDPAFDSKMKLALFGLDPAAIEARAAAAIPDEDKLSDMTGLLTSGVRYDQLRRMSLREAEEALFGDGCAAFFHTHFKRPAQERLLEVRVSEELRRTIARQLADNPTLEFYQLAAWTDDKNESGNVLEVLYALIKDIAREVELARDELESFRETRVEDMKFQRVPLLDKVNLRAMTRALLSEVYGRSWQLLKLESELTLYRRFAEELEKLHGLYQSRVRQMDSLEDQLREAALYSIRMDDEYTGQNIMDYYERVTAGVMSEIEDKRGALAWFDERYIGRISDLLDEGTDKLAERLIDVCRKHILTAAPFRLPFEEELLQRANVSVDYSNRQALSKEELFHRLYRTLEDNAIINIRLLDYTHEHRHEEKYLFGDSNSEFIRYSLGVDETSRIYKLGCVHELRSSGVEKLNMMGGFHLEDLLYYRNGKVYYETYVQSGYEFHGADQGLLPELR